MEQHSHLIHSLDMENIDIRTLRFEYPNLQKLNFRRYILLPDLIGKSDPTPLIRQSPALVESDLRAGAWQSVGSVERPLIELCHLGKLSVTSIIICTDAMDDFWRVCGNLEILSLTNFSISECSTFANIFQRMRGLIISTGGQFAERPVFDLVQKCPVLEHLNCMPTLEGLSQWIGNGMIPRLRSMMFQRDFTDDERTLILQGMQQVTSLDLSNLSFGPRAFQALIHHFCTLTQLDISKCDSVTSIMVVFETKRLD